MRKEKGKYLIAIKIIFLVFIGFASGFVIAGAVFAFVTLLGVINRLASRTQTARHIVAYENFIIAGGTIGNYYSVFQPPLPIGRLGMAIFGLFSGIFIGCQAMALAETLKVIPIFTMRLKIQFGIPYFVLALALGKSIGALIQLYIWK